MDLSFSTNRFITKEFKILVKLVMDRWLYLCKLHKIVDAVGKIGLPNWQKKLVIGDLLVPLLA